MEVPAVDELLNVWEQGLPQPLLQRVLILLVAAFPELEISTLAKLSIGQRDLRLLQLRERLFGTQLLNTALCPECNNRVEWESDISDFVDHTQSDISIENEFNLDIDDYNIRFRLPNSLDIAALVNHDFDQKSKGSPHMHLLSRCLISIESHQAECDPSQLPESVLEKVSEHIDRLDPCADIRINMQCPECTNNWEVLFDIGSYLWAELNDWAERMLQKVHKLATAYGWSEREILQLSPLRRQLYIGMLES